jgi:hypothetical protein
MNDVKLLRILAVKSGDGPASVQEALLLAEGGGLTVPEAAMCLTVAGGAKLELEEKNG